MKPKKVRNYLGCSQSKMAKHMGVQLGTYRKWERGYDGRGVPACPSKMMRLMVSIKRSGDFEKYFK